MNSPHGVYGHVKARYTDVGKAKTANEEEEIHVNLGWKELRNTWSALWKHWKLIVIGTFVAGIAASGFVLTIKEVFRAETSYIVARPAYKEKQLLSTGQIMPQTYAAMFRSQGILGETLENMRTDRRALAELEKKGLSLSEISRLRVEEILAHLSSERYTPRDAERLSQLSPRHLTGLKDLKPEAVQGMTLQDLDLSIDITNPVEAETNVSKAYSPRITVGVRGPSPLAAMYMANTLQDTYIENIQELARLQIETFSNPIEDTFDFYEGRLREAEGILLETELAALLEIRQTELDNKMRLLNQELQPLLTKTQEQISTVSQRIGVLQNQLREIEADGRWIGEFDLEENNNLGEIPAEATGIRSETFAAKVDLLRAYQTLISFRREAKLQMKQALLTQKIETLRVLEENLAVQEQRYESAVLALQKMLPVLEGMLARGEVTIKYETAFPAPDVFQMILAAGTLPESAIARIASASVSESLVDPRYEELARQVTLLEIQRETGQAGRDKIRSLLAQLTEEAQHLTNDIERDTERLAIFESRYQNALATHKALERRYWDMRQNVAIKMADLRDLMGDEEALKKEIESSRLEITKIQEGIYRDRLRIRQQEREVDTHRSTIESLRPILTASRSIQVNLPVDITVSGFPSEDAPRVFPKRGVTVILFAFFVFLFLCAFALMRESYLQSMWEERQRGTA